MNRRRPTVRTRAYLALLAVGALAALASIANAQRIPDGIVLLYEDVRVGTEMGDLESILPRFSSLLHMQMALGRGWGHELALMFQQRDSLTTELRLDEVEVVGEVAFVRAAWTFAGITTETGEKWEASEQRADVLVLKEGAWSFMGSDLIDQEALATKVTGRNYDDPKTGLSATAPAGWRLIPFEAGTKAAVAAWAPDLAAWAMWVVADLPGTFTAEELARSELEVIDKLGATGGFASRDETAGEATLAGRPAFRTSRTLVVDEDTELFTARVYCVVGSTVYVFVGTAIPPAAYATHQEALEGALASTKITEPTVTELPPEAGRVEDGTYINDVYGYRIKAPEGWDIKIGEGEWKFQVHMNEPGGASYILVGMVELPVEGATAEAVVQDADDATSRLTESFELIERGETTVADLPAHQSVVRFETAGTMHQRQRVHLIENGRLYFIIADAVPAEKWDELADAFDGTIKSVEFFEAQPIDEAR